ncbi:MULTISPECIES: penicillin-binding transpeptidase domain-containing protein [Actinokineospora]|uniref:Penicillin-binding protein n=1 Tax=Actinokineospora fastidiosa TaxID=1816 RepID=A0A918GJH7_9PSEU|nr:MULTISPECIES: penicillin-binding transpeptidase domain-containing protein [Actinokineospora]UVS81090.1 Penicillin-binding protein 1* [Actinokineospora sp. UTMC 2448]GGS39446.1 penicillin-binding protein [Actinokineospora fastidiosa]
MRSLRRPAALAAALIAVLPLTACTLFGGDSGPRDVAAQFLAAFAGGDAGTAAAHTDSPESARALMDQVRDKLKPSTVRASVVEVTEGDGEVSDARYTITWDLGKGRLWTYDSTFELRRGDEAWKVHWAPNVLHPRLSAGQSLAVETLESPLAPVLDRDGTAVLSPIRVISVLFEKAKAGDPDAVAASLARALSGIDRSITKQSILDGAAEAATYTVVVLRETDYQKVRPAIYELPGVRFTSETRLLAPDKSFAPALVPAIRDQVEAVVEGKAGWRVHTVDSNGAEVTELFAEDAEPADAVRTVLSAKTQRAAERALAAEQKPAMLVAIQPSTGHVLAVAQNPAADKEGPVALMGRYPPGSTFKIVTAAAAIESGLAKADTPLPCPPTTTINGRVVPNSDRFDKGTVPLHSAFAFSCNTTFADLAVKMQPSTLTDMATRLGLGVDFVVPGITTITGSVPPATDIVERAEDGFGQGKVVASPFGMAVVTATVVSGRLTPPTLMEGATTQANMTPEPLPAAVLTPIRQMMREVVTGGTATALNRFPDTHGKTGTAQFGDGTHSHGWFVGYRGDLAFAVLVTDAGTSGPAVAASGRFLGGLG